MRFPLVAEGPEVSGDRAANHIFSPARGTWWSLWEKGLVLYAELRYTGPNQDTPRPSGSTDSIPEQDPEIQDVRQVDGAEASRENLCRHLIVRT